MSELKVTSAEDYAQIESPEDEISIEPMPSGAAFKMRRANMAGMVLIGALPQSLVNIGLAAWRQQGKAEAAVEKINEQDTEETIRQLIFMRQTVVDNVLEPRIGYEAGAVYLFNAAGNPITTIKPEDFRYAFRWITRQEGVKAPGLETFREGQERGTVADSVDNAEHGDASERTPEAVEVVQ